MKVKSLFHFVLAGIIFLMLSASSWSQIREPDIFPFAQNNTILTKTAGVFNFDNDDFFDIIGIASQIDAKGNQVPRSTYLVHLESTVSGDLNILWKLAIPENLNGDFTDIVVSDLDGDGSPEISAVISISEIISGKSPGSLLIFKYADGFAKEPTAIINIAENQSVRPRPLFIDAGDMNGDQKSDLIVSSVGPCRGITIIGFNGQVSQNNVQVIFQSSSLKVLLGFLQFRAVSTELDTFPGEDLLIFGGKKDLEVEVYRYDFRSAPDYSYTFMNIDRSEVDLSKIVWGDLDGDGFDEVLIPLKNGGAQLLYVEDDVLKANLLFPKEFKLTTAAIMDLNSNGLDQILFQQFPKSGMNEFEFNVSGSVTDLASYDAKNISDPQVNDVRYLTIVPVLSSAGKATGSIVVPYIHPNLNQHGLFYWAIKDLSPIAETGIVDEVLGEIDFVLAKKDTSAQVLITTPVSEAERLTIKFQGIEGEEIGLAPLPNRGSTSMAVQRKETVKPDFVVHPGEVVQNTITISGLSLSDVTDLTMNIQMPLGMKFDLGNRAFTWVPADSQLGLHKISAQFSWGSKKVSQSFTVYVNAKPMITAALPIREIVQIGETFRSKIESKDDNTNAQLTLRFISSPAGAIINQDGEIVWKPSFDQADWYDFAVEVSDGYDAARMDFALFINHPVSIESVAPNMTAIGKPYSYQPTIKDNNKGFFIPWYSVSPRITDWKTTGIYETAILDDAVRGNLSKLIVRYKKSFLAESAPNKSASGSILDVFEDQNKLVFVFQIALGKTPTAAEIIGSFFNALNMSTPKYAPPVRRCWYTFTMKESPNGLKMNDQGLIDWKPAKYQFDFQSLSYSVSDGYFSAEENAQIYVNYPPNIISTPDTIAYVNGLWQYETKVTDLNTDAKLTYELIKAPDGMVISPQGVISWRPTEVQINRHSFSIRVSDGIAKDIQKATIFVNIKPRILSVPKPVALTGMKYEYLLEAEDPNGDAMVFKAIRLPKTATFDPDSRMLVWTPKKTQKGVNDVVLEIVDSHGWSTLQEFQIHVFQNPSGRKFSFFWNGISIAALIGVIYLII